MRHLDLLELLSFGPEGWGRQLASGAWLTVRLAVVTLPFGLLLGLLLAVAIIGTHVWLARFAVVFTTIFRALPELLTIFIIYYGIQILLQDILNAISSGYTIEINGFVAGIISLGIVFGAYASETFVAGLRAIPRGQHEAAQSLGLSASTTFFNVTLPQLWRLTLPALGNLWLVLLKDTALVSVISLNELMRETSIAVANTKQPLFFYGVACLIYFLISLVSGRLFNFLERRSNRGFEVAR